MKAFKYILIVLLTGLILSIAADYFLQKGFQKSHDDVIGKLNVIIRDSSYYDVICFGSSRALAHFNPEVIAEETNLKAFNAGLNGGCVVDFNALLKVYLNIHPNPGTVVIHVDEFSLETQTISELPRYFPFISNDILYENLVPYNETFIAVKYIPFLRVMYYNDLLKWISFKSWLHLDARDEYKMADGYRSNESKWTGYFDERMDERLKMMHNAKFSDEKNKSGVKLFIEMLEVCKQKNIKMILTSSPILGGDNFEMYDTTCEKLEQISAGYDVSYLWMHKEQWSPHEYYYDFTHMNSKGADRFSHELATFINESKKKD